MGDYLKDVSKPEVVLHSVTRGVADTRLPVPVILDICRPPPAPPSRHWPAASCSPAALSPSPVPVSALVPSLSIRLINAQLQVTPECRVEQVCRVCARRTQYLERLSNRDGWQLTPPNIGLGIASHTQRLVLGNSSTHEKLKMKHRTYSSSDRKGLAGNRRSLIQHQDCRVCLLAETEINQVGGV
ncbi:hypothetical protein J6590_012309 [Homalodisca vitripennis]|nr:hypothetical protein J6590_012309 [Homalodisca vitripennis]